MSLTLGRSLELMEYTHFYFLWGGKRRLALSQTAAWADVRGKRNLRSRFQIPSERTNAKFLIDNY